MPTNLPKISVARKKKGGEIKPMAEVRECQSKRRGKQLKCVRVWGGGKGGGGREYVYVGV